MELKEYSNEQILKEAKMRQEQLGEENPKIKTPTIKPVEFPCICSTCGKNTTVPFKPREGWSVYCRECYAKRNN